MKRLRFPIHRWKWAHRGTALAFLLLLILGGRDWFPWFKGSTTASTLLEVLPLVDPLAALETTLASGSIELTLLLGALLLVGFGFLLGPVFCGWVCPLGLLLDLNQEIRKGLRWALSHFRIPLPEIEMPGQIRYVILGLVLGFSLVAGFPAFQTISPINLLSWLLVFYPRPISAGEGGEAGLWETATQTLHTLVHAGGPLLIILLLILAAEFVSPRVWCRSLCPLGALYSLIGNFAPLRIRASEEAMTTGHCARCTIHCTIHCPMGIKVSEEYTKPGKPSVDHPACTRCGECMDTCSRGNLRLGFRDRNSARA